MKKIVIAIYLSVIFFAAYSQQNVGIGTNNPGSKLQVSGSLAAGWANQTTTPYSLGTNDYYDAWSGTANGTFNLPAAINGAGNFVGRIYILKNATSAYTLTIQANGSEKIDGASSISVQPGNSVTLISNGSNGAVTTWNVVSSTPSSGSATGWSTGGNAGTTPSSSAIGTAANNNFAGTTDAKDFVVATSNLERMRLTSGGNLGIGVVNPAWPFVIRNTGTTTNTILASLANAAGSMDANFELVTARGVTTDNNSGDVTTQIGLNYAGGTTLNSMIRFHRGGSTIGGFMSFTTNNNTEAMRIDALQNVGIGTTTPTAQLHTTGTVRFANYPNGIISTDASGNLQTVAIGGSANQIDVANGNGAANPAISIDPAYTAEMKSQAIMTGGGTVTYSGGYLSWSSRFIVINNGTGSQFSTNGYFDIIQPPNGTVIQGVGSAASVTATGSGVPLGCWEALYYILPVGSSNGVVYSNYRIAQYGAGFVVPESWIMIANNNCDDGSVRLGNGITLTPGQSSNNGSGAYIDNGTASQTANFNITGNGYIGGKVGVGTTSPAYTLDLNQGTFGFGASNERTEYQNDAGAINGATQSGFFQTSAPAPAADWPVGANSWWHLIDCRHTNGSNYYAMQFAGSFFDQNLYFRKLNGSPNTAWERVMTSSDISGTTNYISKFTSSNTIGNSQVYDDGTNVGIGIAPGYQKLTVNGNATIGNGATYGTGSPGLAIGQNSDFRGNGGWPGSWNSNLLLIGNPDATITFAHETNSLANIRYSNGVFYVGDNAGWGDKILQTPTNTYLAVNSGSTGIGTTAPNGKLDVYNSGANGDGAVFAPDIDLDNNFTIQTYIDAAAGGGWANRTTYAGTCCNNLALQPDVGTVSIGGTSGNYGSNKLNVLGQSYFSGFVGLNTTAPNRRLDIASGTGDRITFGQTQDNTETIQTYIDGQWSNRSTYASGCCNLLAIQPDVGQVCIGAMSATAKFEINLSNPLGWSGNLKATRVFAPDNGYYLDMNTYIVAGGNVGYQFSPNGNTGMVITTPGLVGIGTTSPGYTLDVNGEIHNSVSTTNTGVTAINALFDQTNSGYYAGMAMRNTSNGGGAALFGQYASGSGALSQAINVAQVSPFGGTNYAVVNAANYYYASDISLKKDIRDLGKDDFNACMEQIRNIRSILYRYNNESASTEEGKTYRRELHIGFAAQSLPKEVAGNISTDPSSETGGTKLGVSVSDFNGLMLAGVKALDNHEQNTDELLKVQQETINHQQQKIDAQQQQIDELRKAIDELKEKK